MSAPVIAYARARCRRGYSTTELEQQVAQAEQTYLLQQLAYSNTLQPDAQAVTAAQVAVNSAQAAYQAAQQKYGTHQDQVMLSCINVQNAADAVGAARDSWMKRSLTISAVGYRMRSKAAGQCLIQPRICMKPKSPDANLAKNNVSDSSLRSAQAQVLEAQRTLSNLISPTATSLIMARADLESVACHWRPLDANSPR